MAILKIARLGHPVLRRPADPVPPELIGSPRLERLIEDMLDTVKDADGAGLAAPQVHASVRVVLLSLDPEVGFEIWINPVLTPLTDDELVTFEGCLSVPGLRGAVARPAKVRVQALLRDGTEIDRVLEDYPAVVAQHECDHLDGVLYVDLVEPGTLMFTEEYRRYGPWMLPSGDDEEEE